MRSAMMLIRYPNQTVPDDFTEKLLETHTTSLGFAVVKDGIVDGYAFDALEHDLLNAFDEVEKKFPTEKVFYHWSQADDVDTEFSAESQQPFAIIKNEEGDSLLSIMLEGELNPTYTKDGCDTPEYNAVNEYISSKITAIYQQTGGNLEKLMQILDTPQIRADMMPVLSPRGVLIVIPAEGKPLAFSDNKLGMEFKPWGYVTKTLGYSEPTQQVAEPEKSETVAAVTQPRLTLKERQARAAALKAAADEPAAPVVEPAKPGEVKKEDQLPVTAPDGKPITSPHFMQKDGVLWCKVEKGASLQRAKAFWNAHCSLRRPEDEKQVWVGFPASNLKADSPLRELMGTKSTAIGDAMQKATNGKKPLEAEAAVDKNKGPIQIIPVEDRQRAMGLTLADKEASKAKTFAEILDSQKEFPKYTEQTGTTLNDACRLSTLTYFKMGQRSLANLANELRTKLVELDPSYGEPPVEKKIEESAPAEVPAEPQKLTAKERLALRKSKAA